MIILLKVVYIFNTISIKIQASSFVVINKLIPKPLQKDKRPRIFNTILKSKFRELTLSNSKNYCKAKVIKIIQY